MGEKDIDVESKWAKLFMSSWEKNILIELSANVSQVGEQTRVRVNLQRKLYDNRGHVVKVHPIYDSEYYQAFFDKISGAVAALHP